MLAITVKHRNLKLILLLNIFHKGPVIKEAMNQGVRNLNIGYYYALSHSRAPQYIDISSYRGINKAIILYLGPANRNRDTEISIIPNI